MSQSSWPSFPQVVPSTNHDVFSPRSNSNLAPWLIVYITTHLAAVKHAHPVWYQHTNARCIAKQEEVMCRKRPPWVNPGDDERCNGACACALCSKPWMVEIGHPWCRWFSADTLKRYSPTVIGKNNIFYAGYACTSQTIEDKGRKCRFVSHSSLC